MTMIKIYENYFIKMFLIGGMKILKIKSSMCCPAVYNWQNYFIVKRYLLCPRYIYS